MSNISSVISQTYIQKEVLTTILANTNNKEELFRVLSCARQDLKIKTVKKLLSFINKERGQI